MTSVTYELWNDTGYTESGVERPPIGASLASPDHRFTLERPNKDDMFSKVSVKEDYVTLMNVSYLRATYNFNESEDIVIYGWVDSVELKSDTSGYPMVNIYWHPDLWRTYAQKAVFRAGTVRRRPLTSDIPPQPYPFRYRMVDSTRTLIPTDGLWWVLFNWVDGASEDSILRWAAIPVDVWQERTLYIGDGVMAQHYQTPNITQVKFGMFEELFHIDPQSIVSASLSPVAPVPYRGAGTDADPIVLTQNRWNILSMDDTPYGMFIASALYDVNYYHDYTASLPSSVHTDDVGMWCVINLDGSTIGTLPWGLNVRTYTYRVVNAIVGQYIQVRFDGLNGYPEGLTFTIPLPNLSITSNSWSSYVYSGQREYDIMMRRTQTDHNFQRSIVSAVSGAGEQAGLSTMFGGLNTAKGSTMMSGGMITAISNILGSAVNYGFEQGHFNNEYQKWEDYAAAHQTDNILLPGEGLDMIYHGCPISLKRLTNDSYSTQQRNSDISLYGAHVTEPLSSCQALVLAGGPLQITNMTVGGDIPVEAKEYIRMMFSNGVRLV